ncbi:MAG: SagB/ThcOx family dehydrogenase, partial [Haloglomus sp.]
MVDAREYHERTDHSPRSVRESDVRLDRSNKPRPYKVYENLPAVEPSGEPSPPPVPALAAVAQPAPVPVLDGEHSRDGNSDRSALDVHTLCRYAAGVTKTREQGGRELRFRAAACTGKLYHVDLYAVVGDVPGFDPGVYHYDPDGDAFDALREGDYRSHLAAAAGAADGGVADAPVTFVATSEWWRNAWKYRARTYRHAFWDSGTVLANLLAVAHAGGHHARVVTAFADDPVVRLLGVDPDDEAPLELVAVGGNPPSPAPPPGSGPDPDPVDPEPLEPIAPAEKPL